MQRVGCTCRHNFPPCVLSSQKLLYRAYSYNVIELSGNDGDIYMKAEIQFRWPELRSKSQTNLYQVRWLAQLSHIEYFDSGLISSMVLNFNLHRCR